MACQRPYAVSGCQCQRKEVYLDFERYWLDRALDYEWAEWFGGKP
jgi:hypothetical protein